MGTSSDRWTSRARAVLLAVVVATLGTTTCGGDDTSSASTSAPTTLPPCALSRHIVAFDVFGTVTASDDDLAAWLETVDDPPDVRPGADAVVSAYRALGYEILYVTTTPPSVHVGDTPIGEAIAGWLDANGFPQGEGTHLWGWDGNHTPMIGIGDELERLHDEGASIDAAYTDNQDKAFAFKTSVPSESVYTIGPEVLTSGSTPLTDLQAHAAQVEASSPVCQPG